MKRFLAVVAAVALVGGAWWIRQTFIEDDGDGGTAAGEGLRLLCGTDVAAACRQLAEDDDSIQVRVEDEGTTADVLSGLEEGTDAGFDAWITAGPWAEIVADNRRAAGLDGAGPVLGGSSEVLGRSPVTLVGPNDRMDALAAHCGGAVTWVCIGDASGRPWADVGGRQTWGEMKAGLAPPDTGAGLVALDQAVADRTDRTDWDTLDLDDAASWFGQLVDAAEVSADPLSVMLTRPGSFSVAAPLEQQSGPGLSRAANGSQFSLLYPEPVVTADVVLTAAADEDAADVLDRLGADRLGDALAESGWRVQGRSSVDGVGGGPALPEAADLASPGALQALRIRWEQLGR